jgi:hypothetical protein
VVSIPEEPPIEISDSTSKALNDVVNEQFDSLFLVLADSASYYRVALTDYFDEWEGQNEGWHTIWYFDKEFNAVYSRYIHESGTLEGRDVKEYGLKDNRIVFAREDTNPTNEYEERTITLWDAKAGGVQMIKSLNTKKMSVGTALPGDYEINSQKDWDSGLDKLKDFLNTDAGKTENDDIYTVLLQVPKPAELMDYTRVIIPKPVYNKFKNDEN